jgi:hypothetical protein
MGLKPVCVKCHRFFKPKRNGMTIIEGMPRGGKVEPGLSQADSWKPYKLWMVDLWECLGCGTEIFHGSGANPIAYHHEPHFTETMKARSATFQVNDC